MRDHRLAVGIGILGVLIIGTWLAALIPSALAFRAECERDGGWVLYWSNPAALCIIDGQIARRYPW